VYQCIIFSKYDSANYCGHLWLPEFQIQILIGSVLQKTAVLLRVKLVLCFFFLISAEFPHFCPRFYQEGKLELLSNCRKDRLHMNRGWYCSEPRGQIYRGTRVGGQETSTRYFLYQIYSNTNNFMGPTIWIMYFVSNKTNRVLTS
jgi:hypothetical protein